MAEEKIVPAVQKTKHRSLWVMLLLAAIIFLAGYFIYVAPAVRQAAELSQKDTLSLEVELGQKQTRLFAIKKLAKDFDNLPQDLITKLKESLPAEPSDIDLLANLTALVAESGLELNTVEISRFTDTTSSEASDSSLAVKEVPITLEVEGITYSKLKQLIRNLELNLRLLRLDNFSFNLDSTAVSLELTAFYLE